MSAPTTLETGRANVVASFNKWVQDEIASLSPLPAPINLTTGSVPFTVKFERPIQTADLATGPVLCVSDVGLFSPARVDVNDRAVYSTTAGQVFASREQTLFEFVVWGSQSVRPDEDVRIRMVRDAVVGAYRYAGRKNSSGVYVVNPLRIYVATGNLDPAGMAPTNNFIEKDRDASWLTEGPVDDPDHPELRGWRGVVRVFWLEFFDAP